MLEAPLPSAGIVIRRVFTLERGLFAAPALLEKFGEPRTLDELRQLPLLTGPSDPRWAITAPAAPSSISRSIARVSPLRMLMSACKPRSPAMACCG